MNQKSIAVGILLVIALPMAILVGQWAAMDPKMAIAFGLSVVGLVTIIAFGKNVWALIFFAYPFVGALNALPISISVRDLTTLGVAGLVVLMLATRTIRLKFQFGLLEISLLAVFAMIAQAFIRNPAGVAALGSSSVGGRANFEMAIAALLFLTLAIQVVPLAWIKRSMWLFIGGQVLASGVEIATNVVPGAGMVIAPIYRPALLGGLGDAVAGSASEFSIGRLVYFQDIALELTRLLVSLHSPLQLLNPFKARIVIVLGTVVIALMTGFRSLIAGMAAYGMFSAILRRRQFEIAVIGFAGFCLYAVLAVGNRTLFDVPLPAQRALSMLPGNWDYLAKGDAESSAEWRFEMWRQALGTDRYIKNKLFGDGYSIPPDVLAYQQSLGTGVAMSPEVLQEYYLLIGGYHSGPVETIRRIGYVGLLVFLFCQIVMFREAYRTIISLRGTEYFTYAIFAGLPMVAGPFIFWLIVGGLHTELIPLCLSAAWMRMIQHSAKEHSAAKLLEAGVPPATIPGPGRRMAGASSAGVG